VEKMTFDGARRRGGITPAKWKTTFNVTQIRERINHENSPTKHYQEAGHDGRGRNSIRFSTKKKKKKKKIG